MEGKMKTVVHSAKPAIMPKIKVRSSMKIAANATINRYEKHTIKYTL